MLESVKFKNFRSFSSETFIDLKPSKIEYLNKENINDGVLKGCAFYGSNASGKTNALLSITILLDLLFKDIAINPDTMLSKFSSDKFLYFEYTFRIDGKRIIYYFEYHIEKGFTAEKLYLDGELLLDRTLTSAKSYITENQDYDEIDRGILFIRNIYFNTKFNNQPILNKWFTFLKNSIYFNPIREFNKIVTFDPKTAKEIKLYEYITQYGVEEINSFLKEYEFPFLIQYNPAPVLFNDLSTQIFVARKQMKPIPFYMESTGNQILLTFLPSFIKVVKDGGILAIDEFSSGFHNDLEEFLVKYFFKKCKNGQIFFVSHSTNLLKTSLIRPDQVYAVDLDNTGSVINKFSNYGMRESQNMEKMYLAGAFGGIPTHENNN